jgi:hypothetical protein
MQPAMQLKAYINLSYTDKALPELIQKLVALNAVSLMAQHK